MEKPQLSPYFKFPGNCEEAMNFYKTIFGGELEISKFGDAPIETSPEQKDKVIHASLITDYFTLFGCDVADPKLVIGDNVDMSIVGMDTELLRKYFAGLSEGGKVELPLTKQYWGDEFGMVSDKYTTHWMINIGSGKPPKK